MFKVSQPMVAVLSAVTGLVVLSTATRAQDPAKVAPDNYKVALDNDFVRVNNVQAKAGEKIATHSHPDHLVYAITAGKLKFTYPDGKTKEVELKAGDATWIKAETHATENVGAAEFKAIVVELKKPAPTGGTPAKVADADDQAKVAADSTKVVLDNERVRVLDVHLKAGGKLAKHAHPANVVCALTGGKLKFTYPDGKTEEKSLAAGQAIWSDPVTHAVDSVGTEEAHSLVVELKEPAKGVEKKGG